MGTANQMPNENEPCCKRPAVALMDHPKHTPDDWSNPRQMINRVCTNCYAHWYGEVGAVKQYTRKEWDAYVAGEAA